MRQTINIFGADGFVKSIVAEDIFLSTDEKGWLTVNWTVGEDSGQITWTPGSWVRFEKIKRGA